LVASVRLWGARDPRLRKKIGDNTGQPTPGFRPFHQNLVPRALEAASGGRPLTVFGIDYPTPDGTCIRDYIHVVDLADAHLRALAALDSGIASQPLNLGAGRGISVREIIAMVEAVTGQTVNLDCGPRRPGDPPELVADARRARNLLGWAAHYSDALRIVESAWAWHCRKRERIS